MSKWELFWKNCPLRALTEFRPAAIVPVMAKTTVEFPEEIKVQLPEGVLERIERLVGSKYKRAGFIRDAAVRRLEEEELARGERPSVSPEIEAAARLFARAVHQRDVGAPGFDLELAVENDWPRFVKEAEEVVEVVGKTKNGAAK